MPSRRTAEPVRMCRVAVVAPRDEMPNALAIVADAGVVEFDRKPEQPDKARIQEYADSAATRGSVAGLVGWCPQRAADGLAERLSAVGASVVPLPAPRGVDPPTLLSSDGRLQQSFVPVVNTYGTVPYVDVDPTLLAGVAYVLMFGMMFGDVGHGALLVGIALLLRIGWPRKLAGLRHIWPFVAGAGLAATAFGLLYGEFFGPTGVVRELWLRPLDEPIQLLAAGVGLGGVLLAGAYAVGTVNRWREGGSRLALYAPSGIAGATVFLGVGLVAAGVYSGIDGLTLAGGLVAGVGLVLAAVGLYAGTGGGGAGVAETGVQLFDLVIRLGSNLVSFARLAAFGMTHAALGLLVWQGTAALAGAGWLGVAAAVLVFAGGNVVTFGLEALVAGIQALRLEFYELFSRVFEVQGRPFRPWHVPLERS